MPWSAIASEYIMCWMMCYYTACTTRNISGSLKNDAKNWYSIVFRHEVKASGFTIQSFIALCRLFGSIVLFDHSNRGYEFVLSTMSSHLG